MNHLRAIIGAAVDFLIPPKCLLCGGAMRIGDSRAVCAPCMNALERLAPPLCPRCGAPFRSPLALVHSPAHVCAACAQDAPHFDRARALGPFEGALRELVHLFKFGAYTKLAREFAPHLAEVARSELSTGADTLLTHVPIDPARWRLRGFDQSHLLARATAEHLGLPHAECLERAREGRSQTGLSARERRRNMRGVFRVRDKARAHFSEKACILVDDVVTTGATASACARELKRAGAASVCLLTICRA